MTIELHDTPPTSPGEYLMEFYSLGLTKRVLAVVGKESGSLVIRVAGIKWDSVKDFTAQFKTRWSEDIDIN